MISSLYQSIHQSSMSMLSLSLSLAFLLLTSLSLSAATFQEPNQPPISPPFPTTTDDILSATTQYLGPVLAHLGFHTVSSSFPSLHHPLSSPFTIFAPSDSSIRSCPSCSLPRLLSEHIVPGIFSLHYLRNLAFGTKIETLLPGRCLTVTFSENDTAVFIGGVQITRPDLFNNGLFVIHGLEGFVTHLSPLSCQIEKMTSLSFADPLAHSHQQQQSNSNPLTSLSQVAIMRVMLADATLRLRLSGYHILSLALRIKLPELVGLNNMTVFTVDDEAIFSGGHDYISSVRFHIVPNVMLTYADLEKFPVGTMIPSLEQGQSLVVTTAGSSGGGIMAPSPVRVNYVKIKSPDVMRNLKIVVHGLYLPFPRIYSVDSAVGYATGGPGFTHVEGFDGSIGASANNVAMSPGIKSAEVDDVDDHHGL